MKVILDIKDHKAAFVMELLKNFSFIKAKTISPVKAQYMEELKEAIDNVNLIKQGKIEPKPAKDLLDEL